MKPDNAIVNAAPRGLGAEPKRVLAKIVRDKYAVLAETLAETEASDLKCSLSGVVPTAASEILTSHKEFAALLPKAKAFRAAGTRLSRATAAQAKVLGYLCSTPKYERYSSIDCARVLTCLRSDKKRKVVIAALLEYAGARVAYEADKNSLREAVAAENKRRDAHNEALKNTKRQCLLALKAERDDQITRLYLNGLADAGVEFIQSLPTPQTILARCEKLGLKLPASRFTEVSDQKLLAAK